MERLVAARLKKADEIVLNRGFDDEVEIQGRTGQAVGDESNATDDGIWGSSFFQETRDDPEYVIELQGRYPTTGNTCFGASLSVSSPAASRSAASV